MKRKIVVFILAVIFVFAAFITGCGDVDTEPKTYTIKYTDESGEHILSVTEGSPYSLEVIPEKTGHIFTGLYNLPEGGTQFVSSAGESLSPYTEGKDIVLYPVYRAKEYTVMLNYQGAEITGDRQLTACYGKSLPQLPEKLTIKHKDFMGWYTETGCGGIQVSDSYGLIPAVSVVNDVNFKFYNDSYIYLYAGFTEHKYSVKFYSEDGVSLLKSVEAQNGALISDLSAGLVSDGKTILSWSKEPNGEVFGGEVTTDLNLYARSYGYTVSFDTGNDLNIQSVTVNIGNKITLQSGLTKTGYTFVGWYDAAGNLCAAEYIPEANTVITARWEANTYTVNLDTQGGSVDSVSQDITYGRPFSLAVPARDGYIFDGWYSAVTGGTRITGTDGNGLNVWDTASGLNVYARWIKLENEEPLDIKYCTQDSGYNPNSQNGDDKQKSRHNGFEMVRLRVNNAEKLSNGHYRIPDGYSLLLSLIVLQDVSSLPVYSSSNEQFTAREISDDDYNGSVSDTNINGVRIGRGAYYVKVTYTDGSFDERFDTDILNGKSYNSIINMRVYPEPNKVISYVSVVVVYEFWLQNGWFWQEHSNWRCTTTLYFD